MDRNDRLILFACIPLYFAAVAKYGLKMIVLLVLSAAIGFLLEWGNEKLRKRETHIWGVKIWLLFPLIFPPAFPLWMSCVSLGFGILVTVIFFGGYGRHFASPLAAGWAFAVLSFPADYGFGWAKPFPGLLGWSRYSASVLTIDHPLDYYTAQFEVSPLTILMGRFPQTPGNSLPILVLVLGILLLLLRVINLRGILSFGLPVVVLTLITHLMAPEVYRPVTALLLGNFAFVLFFIWGDERTLPRTQEGRIITSLLAGLTAFIMMTFSSIRDPVLFAILFGNSFSAILDDTLLKRRYKGSRA